MDLKALFASDKELMAILTIIAELELPDAWLAAGTLRNYVWNALSGKPGLSDASDIDIVNFVVQPTPHFLADKDRMVVYHDRLKKKDWQKKWPRLQILA